MIPTLVAVFVSSLVSGWSPVAPLPADYESDVLEVGSRLVALSTGGPRISDDGGNTWRVSSRGLPGPGLCLVGDSREETVVVYCSGRLYRSVDRGDSWQDWSQGYGEPAWGNGPQLALALGDTSAVFVSGYPNNSRTWIRHGNTPWRLIEPDLRSRRLLTWTGSSFLMASEDEEYDNHVLRSVDGESWTRVRSGDWIQDIEAHHDTAWLLMDSSLFRSLDGGATWSDPLLVIPRFHQLLATDAGLLGVRGDSLFRLDPIGRTLRFLVDMGSDWVPSVSIQGTRLVVTLSGGEGLVSPDSGKSWRKVPLPEAGTSAEALARFHGRWNVANSRGVWSSADGTVWDLDTSRGVHAFLEYEGTLLGGGWKPYRTTGGTWTRDSTPTPEVTWDPNYFHAVVSGNLLLSDGEGIWSWWEPGRRWLFLDSSSWRGEQTASTGFAGRIWVSHRAWWNWQEVGLRSWDIASGVWRDHDLPHAEGVMAIGSSRHALWVGTDDGLYRSDDTGRTFVPAGLPLPWSEMPVGVLFVRGDTIATTLQSHHVNILDSRELASWVSLDGGATWNTSADPGLVANAFAADDQGLYATMWGRGIHRWTTTGNSRIGPPSPKTTPTLGFRLRAGAIELVGDPETLVELRDSRGRLEALVRLGSDGIATAPVRSPGLHLASVRAARGRRTLAIPVP